MHHVQFSKVQSCFDITIKHYALVQESKEPERNLVAFAHVALVDGKQRLRLALQLRGVFDDVELVLLVDARKGR